jgi:hypothetical protein
MVHKLLGITLLLFALNCKSTKNQANMNNEDVVLIGEGKLYGSGSESIEKQNLVITNSKDWNALVAKMNAVNNVSDSFTEIDIDFSEYTVIAVFDEVKNSGGHSLNLIFQKINDKVLVEVLCKSPEGIATSVMTQPYYIVKIPKTEVPIEFKKI